MVQSVCKVVVIASPPTRVVWIEMDKYGKKFRSLNSHHPHGWCGLKFLGDIIMWSVSNVTTHTGGVD